MSKIANRLEPGLIETSEGYQASIAISLKRLADVAEATAMGLWNYDPTRDPYGNPKDSSK